MGLKDRVQKLEPDPEPELCEEHPPCEGGPAWGFESPDGTMEWRDGKEPQERCATCPFADRPVSFEVRRVPPEAYPEGSRRDEVRRRRAEQLRYLRDLNLDN